MADPAEDGAAGAGTASAPAADNARLAAALHDFASLIEAQDADPFRVRAYRLAAAAVEASDRPMAEIFEGGGVDALAALPAIGTSIAGALAEMLVTGHWRQLDRMRGELTPERLFLSLPGVGSVLARRLAEQPDCETLEDLERVLADPEIFIAGIGVRRRMALRALVRDRLARLPRASAARDEPDVGTLLEADKLYRQRALAGLLPTIAPRRFNPEHNAWLPVLHASRGPWHITALYSNSERAHRLGRTRDWVVLYFHRDTGPEQRRTVVTEMGGPLATRRVVRGRESDCARYYAGAQPAAAASGT